MVDALVAVGEASDLRFDGFGGILGVAASEAGGDGGSTHLFNGDVGREDPKVRIGDEPGVGVFFRNGLEEAQRDVGKARICAEGTFPGVGESHDCVRAASGQRSRRIDTGIVPGEPDQDGAALFRLHKVLQVAHEPFIAQIHRHPASRRRPGQLRRRKRSHRCEGTDHWQHPQERQHVQLAWRDGRLMRLTFGVTGSRVSVIHETLMEATAARPSNVLAEHYGSLFLLTNATFLSERAHAELRSAESLEALAGCYLREGSAYRAYAILQGTTTTAHARYLLGMACVKLDKLEEAEVALLPDRELRSMGPVEALRQGKRDALIGAVPHGAAGLYVLGVACQRTHRRDWAIAYFRLCLAEDALMWVAFDALCSLGADVDPATTFDSWRMTVDTATTELATELPTPPNRFVAKTLFTTEDSSDKPPSKVPRRDDDSEARRRSGPPRRVPLPRGAKATTSRRPPPVAGGATAASPSKKAMATRSRTSPPPTTKDTRRNGGPETPETAVRGGAGDSSDEEYEKLRRKLLRVLSQLGTARAALARTECQGALRALHGVPPRHFETGWVQHALGRCHFEAADYDAAVDTLQRMRRIEPHRVEGLDLLSTALWHLKDDVELCYLARGAVDLDPRSPEAWCCAGNCLSLQKEHDAAVKCFRRAIAVDPNFAYAYTLCGHEYVANEDFDKAIAMYRHALRVDDRHYNAWYGLGAIQYAQQKYDLAEYHFQRALDLNPRSSVLLTYLGMTFHANGKFDEALSHLRRAADMEPKNPQARFQCANVLLSIDRCEDALTELRIVADAAPREASVHFLMGKVCKKLGKLDDAMMAFLFALDLEPKDSNLIKSAIDRLEEPDIDEDEKF